MSLNMRKMFAHKTDGFMDVPIHVLIPSGPFRPPHRHRLSMCKAPTNPFTARGNSRMPRPKIPPRRNASKKVMKRTNESPAELKDTPHTSTSSPRDRFPIVRSNRSLGPRRGNPLRHDRERIRQYCYWVTASPTNAERRRGRKKAKGYHCSCYRRGPWGRGVEVWWWHCANPANQNAEISRSRRRKDGSALHRNRKFMF
jgi:hypothetical protein